MSKKINPTDLVGMDMIGIMAFKYAAPLEEIRVFFDENEVRTMPFWRRWWLKGCIAVIMRDAKVSKAYYL
jgi:hypothetical protein